MDKMEMKRAILEDLIKMLDKEAGMRMKGMHEMPDGEMMADEEMEGHKEPSVVEIEIEKKPLSEAQAEGDLPPMMGEMSEDMDEEDDLKYLARKKAEMKKEEK